MKYSRVVWKGEARFTSLNTGQSTCKKEKVVIVQAFDSKGLMHGSFKVAYVDEDAGNQVGLKLALTNKLRGQISVGPWHECDDGPFRLYTTAEPNKKFDPSVGGLDVPYTLPTDGQIQVWTLKPFQPYQTWNYKDYWGMPVSSVFDKPLAEILTQLPGYPAQGYPIHINGWGHIQGNVLTRTMLYSIGTGESARNLYMKSSYLTVERQDIQEGKCFDKFID